MVWVDHQPCSKECSYSHLKNESSVMHTPQSRALCRCVEPGQDGYTGKVWTLVCIPFPMEKAAEVLGPQKP